MFLLFLLELENWKTNVRRKHWTTFSPFSFLLFHLELGNQKTIKWHRQLSMTPPSSFHPSAIPCQTREPENVTFGLSLFYTFNFLLLTLDFGNRKFNLLFQKLYALFFFRFPPSVGGSRNREKKLSSLFQLLFSSFHLPPSLGRFQWEETLSQKYSNSIIEFQPPWT